MNQDDSGRTGIDSLGHYIELAKWFVGIGAAVLVFGFDKLTIQRMHGASYALFLASILFLAGATFCGVVASMQLTAYANRVERGKAEGETDSTTQRYRWLGTMAYQACGTFLAIGVVLFSVVWFVTFLNANPRATSNTLVVMKDSNGSPAFLIQPSPPQTAFRILVRNNGGEYSWLSLNLLPLHSQFHRAPFSHPGAPSPATNGKSFFVRFDRGSPDITSQADHVIGRARNYARRHRDTLLLLSANTDTTGSPSYNARLAWKRAMAVRRRLMTKGGIAPARIFVDPLATNSLPVVTGPNDPNYENRTVTIDVRR